MTLCLHKHLDFIYSIMIWNTLEYSCYDSVWDVFWGHSDDHPRTPPCLKPILKPFPRPFCWSHSVYHPEPTLSPRRPLEFTGTCMPDPWLTFLRLSSNNEHHPVVFWRPKLTFTSSGSYLPHLHFDWNLAPLHLYCWPYPTTKLGPTHMLPSSGSTQSVTWLTHHHFDLVSDIL